MCLRAKIERFRSLLDRNNQVLERMAEAGESLGGDLLFDSQYLHQLAAQLEESVQRVILDLNFITDNRYLELMDAFTRIQAGIAELLAARPSVPPVPYVLPLDEVDRDSASAVGDKMARLGEIRRRLNCTVPEGFVITSRACLEVFDHLRLAEHLQNALATWDIRDGDLDRARAIHQRMQGLVAQADIPRDVARSIRRALKRLMRTPGAGSSPALVALRSSAVGEDGMLSFAGLHESCLAVRPADVLDAYRRVLASLFSASAIVYRARHREPLEQALMAVGCMLMVPARSSGVIYSLDPNHPERDELIVSAAVGLGKMVVEGGGKIDRFAVSRTPPHRVMARKVAHKATMYAVDPAGGVRAEPVPPDRRDAPAVSDSVLAELADVALRIERYMKSAQDIEWAQDECGTLMILQTRPLQLEADTIQISRRARAAAQRHRTLLSGKGTIACRGIGCGRVVIVRGDERPHDLPREFVLVARVSSPHLAELVPHAGAVITDVGASTGHLATITREFRVPAIVDTEVATRVLSNGQEVTVDAEENVVYEGRVDELVRCQIVRRSPFEDAREFRILRQMLKRISPLNLKDPRASNFVPRSCETYHDIIRFAHEKAVEYFLEGRGTGPITRSPNCKTVEMAVPLDLKVLDIGGGLSADAVGAKCAIDQIRCLPLRSLLEGLNAPGAWSTEPADMDLDSFMSSAMGPSVLSASPDAAPARNLAVVSDHYLNLSLHLGYHFNQIDSYVSEVRNDNYIYFRFVGGLTDMSRRARRARMISIILEKQDFMVEIQGDFVVARLKKFEQPIMLERLSMLGLLIGFTRQMDVRMRGDAMIAQGVDEFMQALYSRRRSRPERPE